LSKFIIFPLEVKVTNGHLHESRSVIRDAMRCSLNSGREMRFLSEEESGGKALPSACGKGKKKRSPRPTPPEERRIHDNRA
jgi:hypothetical protein